MIRGKQVVVVMPAYNAASTLARTLDEVPRDVVDKVILVDDHSRDGTAEEARRLGVNRVIVHEQNRGYGANQKTCYCAALEEGADIVVMLHPDYQYTPRLIESMGYMIANGVHPVVLGSRILGGRCLRGGMPLYKYVANRALTLVQNILLGEKLSEYHTGYRAYSREVLERIPWEGNSDDFIFDNQFLAQCFAHGFSVGEVSCPTRYFAEASSINLRRSIRYGLGVLGVSIAYFFGPRWRRKRES